MGRNRSSCLNVCVVLPEISIYVRFVLSFHGISAYLFGHSGYGDAVLAP